jgi:hypothetical protein
MHNLTMNGDQESPVIELQATWKGYPRSALQLRNVAWYVNKNPELKKVVQV